MSEEVLWYVARVSGLMAWILAVGALTAGLLARSGAAAGTNAGFWAKDTRNLLGRCSVLALAAHAGATAAAARFDLGVGAVLTGRQDQAWLIPAIVVGVVAAWGLALVEGVRLASRRLSPGGDLVLLLISAAIVGGGAYHAWRIGSDTGNPIAVAVVVLCVLLLAGAGAIGLTSFPERESTDDHNRRRKADAGGPKPGAWPTGLQDEPVEPEQDPEPAVVIGAPGDPSPQRPGPFDQPLAVSLSRRVDSPPPTSVFDRGPEISSAPDVPRTPTDEDTTSPATADRTNGHHAADENLAGTATTATDDGGGGEDDYLAAFSDTLTGSWSMWRLPDADDSAETDDRSTGAASSGRFSKGGSSNGRFSRGGSSADDRTNGTTVNGNTKNGNTKNDNTVKGNTENGGTEGGGSNGRNGGR